MWKFNFKKYFIFFLFFFPSRNPNFLPFCSFLTSLSLSPFSFLSLWSLFFPEFLSLLSRFLPLFPLPESFSASQPSQSHVFSLSLALSFSFSLCLSFSRVLPLSSLTDNCRHATAITITTTTTTPSLIFFPRLLVKVECMEP